MNYNPVTWTDIEGTVRKRNIGVKARFEGSATIYEATIFQGRALYPKYRIQSFWYGSN